MDLNLVVLAGRVATEPEIRTFPSGTTMIRYLVTVRSTEPRRRVDVVPVSLWDPSPNVIEAGDVRGRGVWVAGSVQRRFWADGGDTRSRLEIVAHEVRIVADDANAEGEAHIAV
ncbi:MAG TPA: single-stranded DNA-binding protein [Acidimicrobiia bacterium]|nr:single-stranded DNA-binding protein [Acidimicrobiia bacterium]